MVQIVGILCTSGHMRIHTTDVSSHSTSASRDKLHLTRHHPIHAQNFTIWSHSTAQEPCSFLVSTCSDVSIRPPCFEFFRHGRSHFHTFSQFVFFCARRINATREPLFKNWPDVTTRPSCTPFTSSSLHAVVPCEDGTTEPSQTQQHLLSSAWLRPYIRRPDAGTWVAAMGRWASSMSCYYITLPRILWSITQIRVKSSPRLPGCRSILLRYFGSLRSPMITHVFGNELRHHCLRCGLDQNVTSFIPVSFVPFLSVWYCRFQMRLSCPVTKNSTPQEMSFLLHGPN